MKIKSDFYKILFVIIFAFFLFNCKKESATDSGSSGSITDIDGNVYHSVKIGTQVWMVENLKTTKYRNGDPIINATANWAYQITGAYCWYNNDESNKDTYGALYNWNSVNDSRNVAPTGWHVPSDAEWKTLQSSEVFPYPAANLVETGTAHWRSRPNMGTNKTGFTALPGGMPDNLGSFRDQGLSGYWWSATEKSTTEAFGWEIDSTCELLDWPLFKTDGLSIRCIKD